MEKWGRWGRRLSLQQDVNRPRDCCTKLTSFANWSFATFRILAVNQTIWKVISVLGAVHKLRWQARLRRRGFAKGQQCYISKFYVAYLSTSGVGVKNAQNTVNVFYEWPLKVRQNQRRTLGLSINDVGRLCWNFDPLSRLLGL